MYNILEQAIIDAKALREAALKNAETAVLEKYSDEVKGAIDIMLEAEIETVEEAIIAPEAEASEPALAAAEGEDLCGCPDEGEPDVHLITMDDLRKLFPEDEGEPLDQPVEEFGVEPEPELEEDPLALQESEELDEEIDLVFEDDEGKWTYPEREDVDPPTKREKELFKKGVSGKKRPKPGTARASEESPSAFKTKFEEGLDEDIELDEDMVREIVEKLVVDISPQTEKASWAGTPAAVMSHAEEMELARRSGTEAKEEIEALQDAGERLSVQESKKLEDENRKLKELIYAMKGKLDESILSNAKLLYTNQTLTSASLNERQKNRIVESIQNADSVEEAKVIFETLQSAAGPSTKKAPKSLSEAISRPSLNVPRRKRQNSKHESVVKSRFQALAGIKK